MLKQTSSPYVYPYFVGVNKNVDGRRQRQEKMTEFDHDFAPKRVVGHSPMAQKVVGLGKVDYGLGSVADKEDNYNSHQKARHSPV